MLDIKFLRANFEEVKEKLQHRGEDLADFECFEELDTKRRELLVQTEELKSKRNEVSQQISMLKREKKDAEALILEMREVGEKIKGLDNELREVEEDLERLMLSIPNIPHESTPVGETEDDNVVVRTWGEVKEFNFEPKPHWDLATDLGIVDFERAGKVTGSRFVFYKGAGARLERALISFMLDLHTEEHGYEEVLPPYMVNRASMTGTGQLPKFEEDAFLIESEDYFLIPTAEVPVTNMHRDEILSAEQLPIRYAAFSSCFRSEAGSAGRDTRGLIRQHQFNKVELVKFVKPEESYEELEKLTNDAERVLQLLELPYRVMSMCTGDLGFTAAKKYDIEVWLPSYDTYREISSCSNFEAFQARRANIRFRREPNAKPEPVHTLNGSGLAIGRTVAAILENYQQEDGTIIIPEVLRPYMGGKTVIK
ncbi:serine--tRNA ligase [Bacillus cytotoxicus]|uniref:Serine--tRNA ligase n=1 Tax=Bacillus cytotoxicus (strain DSM 22905 / CIP 110041 / 391-98 / NVH 391-98) TaxID=315749 RepID=SYS_BACCN|nr:MULTISPECIES: serine--tRNA ligase [Bacillus cereus group]A7GJT0.1 RecName: Full=Serine--tRNA ligase; AltName: Full=Seryl-tRNA synthetase; Short=SerRS; AltName: Full=Seryl-tRNA(Ser/Sec) synthetase [Bacillus cytotoxicus NVH 391-98]ABS20388.1 seryl-tRNA synthetase [Bacillus cytotoxicus NVH 391-98]AWC31062.1 serine--tRNA ligase [Bacillus cytotoxicus]AWC35105.1 serine--tRNA ligase [Bacillus cytotoxicus]AWC43137.1 serine--tRNA ligase [Bacillus cytotoxicus]KMT49880.1 seryl-tRNA synthetase [Bacill